MRTKELIEDATQILVSAQNDIMDCRAKEKGSDWVSGFFTGKRSAAKYILKSAVIAGAGKQVGLAIREWVAYYRDQRYKTNLPVAA